MWFLSKASVERRALLAYKVIGIIVASISTYMLSDYYRKPEIIISFRIYNYQHVINS